MMRGWVLAAALLGGVGARLSAQSSWSGTLMGQAIGVIDHVDPTPSKESLTEARIVQPVLMGLASGMHDHLLLTATLDLEGLTMPGGELAPGDWGEGYVDRRHPHTYAHELLAAWVDPLGKIDGAGRLALVVGKGFAPFGTDDPMSRPFLRYPVNHHLSQILERAVGIAQYDLGPATVEASIFNGDGPTKASDWPLIRTDLKTWRFGDSRSVRLIVRPIAGLEIQGSLAHVHSPESRQGGGPDAGKQSVSIRYDRSANGGEWYWMAEYARSSELSGTFLFHSVLIEGMRRHGRVNVAYRYENTERPEELRLLDPFRTLRPTPENGILGITTWSLHTVHLGVALGAPASRFQVQPFVEGTLGRISAAGGSLITPIDQYGTDAARSISIGVKMEWKMAGHRMGRYGVLAGRGMMAGMKM